MNIMKTLKPIYEAILLNDSFHNDWRKFINGFEVRQLENSRTIEESNRRYSLLLRNWIQRMVEKYCPPEADPERVRSVISKHYGHES